MYGGFEERIQAPNTAYSVCIIQWLESNVWILVECNTILLSKLATPPINELF